MKIALGIAYNGANYHGWQRQEKLSSIQLHLEVALSRVADHPIQVICAGRTDSGVHAIGQVVHFDTQASRSERSWILGVNSYLPADIRVQWAQLMGDDFHARFSALGRRYCYVIYNNFVNSALLSKQIAWYCHPLDEQLMAQGANYLIGEHDFTSFRAMECQAKSPIRTIHELTITRKNKLLLIDVKANAFLHHMVRNIVGVLVAIGAKKQSPEWAETVLLARDRTQGGITAPPQGLYFISAMYPEHFNLSSQPTEPWFKVMDIPL